jgi:hypothetical protein
VAEGASVPTQAIVWESVRQEFQGDVASQAGVLGLVDHTQTSTAELFRDLVVGDGLTARSYPSLVRSSQS